MKVFNYLFIAMLSMGFIACSSEDDTSGGVEEGVKTKVQLKIVPAASSKSITGDFDALALEESTINDVTVLVFKTSDGTMDGQVIKGDLTDTEGVKSITIDNTTSGERDFLVIANAPEGVFYKGMSRAEALAKVMTLSPTEASDNLVMANQTVVTQTLSATNNASKNPVSVTIRRLAARVNLAKVDIKFTEGSTPNADFTIQEVFLMNVNTNYNIPGTATPEYKNPFEVGQGDYTFTDGWGHKFTAEEPYPTDEKLYFYAGPNVIAEETEGTETLLVIKGLFVSNKITLAPAEETVYYTVKVNRKGLGISFTDPEGSPSIGTGINSNTIYNLTVTITRKGGTDPGDMPEPAPCEVTVTAEDWKYVNQNVEF
ncbi:fimbrial protein [uncultured Dysgonomonas sp.]|nr:fimbrial protein [uncultured Dysgonomonas sp.]